MRRMKEEEIRDREEKEKAIEWDKGWERRRTTSQRKR